MTEIETLPPALSEIDPALDPTLDHLSRRTLLTRLGAGAAGSLAASMTGAQEAPKQSALSDASINRKDITFESKINGHAAHIKGFLATPKTAGRRGSVIIVHEIFGVTSHIKEVTCRLAQAGFNALAVNFFTREGDPPENKGDFAPLTAFVSKITDAQIMHDAAAAMHYLRSRPDSNHKVGVVGFCWGGRISMLFDAAAPDLNAAVAYYGRISGDKTATQTAYPIDVAAQMHAPLLGHFGAEDKSIPPSEANKLRDALTAAKKSAEIYVYDSAGHAFNNDTRESYRPEAAKIAWGRTLGWFGKYLK